MKKIYSLFLILFIFTGLTSQLFAQTPQYYNSNSTSGGNTFPFSIAAGKLIQFIYLPSDFALPVPCPPGQQITKFWWLHSNATGGTGFYNNLTIRMGQTTDLTLPTGVFYTGQLDTVFYTDTISFVAAQGVWNNVTLTHPYVYDPTKSLVVQISQCGATITGSMAVGQPSIAGAMRRTYNQTAGGCNYIYQGQGTQIMSAGLDVVPAGPSAVALCRNGLNLVIPDNNPTGVQDTILVSVIGGGTIIDINVKIDTILHTWDSDVDATFIHGAIEDTLFHDVGSLGDNFIGTILDDSATTPIQSCEGVSTCAPFTGSYRPANLLSNMNGLPLNGKYILRLVDDLGGDNGTLNGWCITVTYSTATGNIVTTTFPNKYSLSQNYPNPFNPTTKINYEIAKQGLVTLKIYDVLGREVTSLVNELKEAGSYTVDFNASFLSSGIYFYRLESGGFVNTKKMTLIK